MAVQPEADSQGFLANAKSTLGEFIKTIKTFTRDSATIRANALIATGGHYREDSPNFRFLQKQLGRIYLANNNGSSKPEMEPFELARRDLVTEGQGKTFVPRSAEQQRNAILQEWVKSNEPVGSPFYKECRSRLQYVMPTDRQAGKDNEGKLLLEARAKTDLNCSREIAAGHRVGTAADYNRRR